MWESKRRRRRKRRKSNLSHERRRRRSRSRSKWSYEHSLAESINICSRKSKVLRGEVLFPNLRIGVQLEVTRMVSKASSQQAR